MLTPAVRAPRASASRAAGLTRGRPLAVKKFSGQYTHTRHTHCARVVAGRYYKGQRLSSTLNRFLTLGTVVAGTD